MERPHKEFSLLPSLHTSATSSLFPSDHFHAFQRQTTTADNDDLFPMIVVSTGRLYFPTTITFFRQLNTTERFLSLPSQTKLLPSPQLLVIEDRIFSIPYVGHGFRPEYKVDLTEIGDGAFSDPEFTKGMEEKVFKYEMVERDLLEVELAKWSDVDSETGDPAEDLNLDYRSGGQPGSGAYNSNSIKTDANYRFDLPEYQKKRLWILTDEALTDAGWNMKGHSWFVVLAASLTKVKASRQWEKDRDVALRYTSNWGWDEIVATFTYRLLLPSKQDQSPSPLLHTKSQCSSQPSTSLGPIARACLQTISVKNVSVYNKSYKGYIGNLDHEINTFIAQGGFLTVDNSVHQESSHKIAIMEPSNDGLLYDGRIATGWIAHKIYEKTQMKSQLMCFELYDQPSHQSRLRSAAGWLLEAFARDWFRYGGSFEADKLPIENHKTLRLDFTTSWSESHNHFMDASNLAG
ncbi:hypothetical protein C7212DRAFT_343976 [Tuber magnatum]|uniref:Uncharacterized protein n=1 Tax=Tuber magnatum TaxID=42249 RepID=A0A317SQ67_9PEZI|nr:hypothetical protein C7212DRAFT_343976 [Tuber magnatum]